MQSAARINLAIKGANENSKVTVSYNGLELQVLDTKVPLTLPKGSRKLALRIFLDRSVLEVFANETVCVTKTITPLAPDVSLEISAEGGSASGKHIQSWPMKTIW